MPVVKSSVAGLGRRQRRKPLGRNCFRAASENLHKKRTFVMSESGCFYGSNKGEK
jgi:hypothetical protein